MAQSALAALLLAASVAAASAVGAFDTTKAAACPDVLHSLSATAAGVDGTTLIDLGTAARPIVATLGDTTVYSAADNAFIFNSSVGNAISFNNATLGGTFGATLSFWWRHDTEPDQNDRGLLCFMGNHITMGSSPDPVARQYVVSTQTLSSGAPHELYSYSSSDYLGSAPNDYLDSSDDRMTDYWPEGNGTWRHITITVDAGGAGSTFFLDGQIADADHLDLTKRFVPFLDSSIPYSGALGSDCSSNVVNGAIASFQIYNYVLSSAAIASLAAGSAAGCGASNPYGLEVPYSVDAWHDANAKAIYNASVADAFFYAYDGDKVMNGNGREYAIRDGGTSTTSSDLFDYGNYIIVATDDDQSLNASVAMDYTDSMPMEHQAFGRNVAYGTSAHNEATGRGYWASGADHWPSVALAWQSGFGTLVIGTFGNLGSVSDTVYSYPPQEGSYMAAGGRMGNWWTVKHFDHSFHDPTSVDVFFSITVPSAASSIDSVLDRRTWHTVQHNDEYASYMAATGSNFYMGKVLLARRSKLNPKLINETEVAAFVTAYVSGLPLGAVPLVAPAVAPLFSAVPFTSGGNITGISDNYAAVSAGALSTTAASSAQVAALAAATTAAMAAQAATSTAAMQAAAAASAAQVASLNATIIAQAGTSAAAMQAASAASAASAAQIAALTANLTAQAALLTSLSSAVATLTTGFCPPAAAAGRHLLALTPIVPPVGCTPPASPPGSVVTTTATLSVSGINLATFTTASVAAAVAAAAGVSASSVVVAVTDYTITSTVSFTGVALSSLSAAQLASLTAAVDAALPADKLVPVIGAVAAGRRLLDLSFPVTVTNVGADAALAAQTQTVLASPLLLGAAAASVGVPASAASATPAAVAVTVTITVRAPSAAAAAAAAAALSPASMGALASQLIAAGVTTTGVTVMLAPAPPPPMAVSSATNRNLLALLVLLIIPMVSIGYIGGKFIEKKRQALVQQAKSADAAVEAGAA